MIVICNQDVEKSSKTTNRRFPFFRRSISRKLVISREGTIKIIRQRTTNALLHAGVS